MIHSFVASLLIALIAKRAIGQHAEAGYDLSHVGRSTRSISRTVMVPPAERPDEPAGTTARI